MKDFKTHQENFWAGNFGNEYINRNTGTELLASNLHFFSNALKQAGLIHSCLEFGANIGMNLQALKLLFPKIDLKAIEINSLAVKELAKVIGKTNIFHGSIFDYNEKMKVELALVKGVLIHINPKKLNLVYEKLYSCSNKYILVCEYYNPTPITIKYRGFSNRLFKRDFAGEMLDKYSDLSLIDYGFSYRRDVAHPQDDINWFLLKKI
jgi:pseudaminic acid biosynthesis-associated methylase